MDARMESRDIGLKMSNGCEICLGDTASRGASQISSDTIMSVNAQFLAFEISRDHNCDIIMDAMASQITSLTIVYSIVHSGADQRKHQISTSLAFVRGIHRWPVNSPHKRPVTRKMFPFDDVIMILP